MMMMMDWIVCTYAEDEIYTISYCACDLGNYMVKKERLIIKLF